MKKLAILLIAFFVMSSVVSAGLPLPENPANIRQPTMVLPASLRTIEAEAFAETAASIVVLPESTAVIGERAFASIRTLREIHIPQSVQYMADHVFEGSPNLTVFGEANSYAENWAREHDVLFTRAGSGILANGKLLNLIANEFLLLLPFGCIDPRLLCLLRRRRNTERSMRPQDRPELNPIDYRFP